MNSKPLDIAGFLKLVIEALESAGIEYLIGGAIAEWAWGEPRATQDPDLVVDIPFEAVTRLSNEFEARDMPAPPEIILDALTDERLSPRTNTPVRFRPQRFLSIVPITSIVLYST
jgi:hypothetical protein